MRRRKPQPNTQTQNSQKLAAVGLRATLCFHTTKKGNPIILAKVITELMHRELHLAISDAYMSGSNAAVPICAAERLRIDVKSTITGKAMVGRSAQ